VYLAHHVILKALAWHWPGLGWAPTLALGAVATLAVAEPMRRFVERPCAAAPAAPAPRAARRRASAGRAPTRVAADGDHGLHRHAPAARTPRGAARRPALAAPAAATRWSWWTTTPRRSARAVVAARAARAPYPIRYAVEPRKNIAHARNGTVALARGDWLAFVDDDERCGAELAAHARARRPCATARTACSGRSSRSCPSTRRAGFGAAAACTGSRTCARAAVVPLNRMRFGNVLLSAPLVRAQQPRSTRVRADGGEDGDLLTRLVQAGARIVWCDEAPVHEPVDASRLSLRMAAAARAARRPGLRAPRADGRYGPPTAHAARAAAGAGLTQAAIALLLALLSCRSAGTARRTGWPRPARTSGS
jgi:succinoglycan biosynthesis protein ExoM